MKPEAIFIDHPFLKSLKPEHLRVLAESALPAHFEAGELIFREDEIANRFYLIQSGKVALDLKSERGPLFIQDLGTGDVLGWEWLFPPHFWRLSARAVQSTAALFFYGAHLREKCEADHELGFEITKRLADVVVARFQAVRRELIECQDTVLSALDSSPA